MAVKKVLRIYYDIERATDFLLLLSAVVDSYSYPILNDSTNLLLEQLFKKFKPLQEKFPLIYNHYVKNIS